MDSMLQEAADALFSDLCTPQALRAIEAGGDAGALWQACETSGFADALVPEAQGGAGLALADVFGLILECGRHVLPVPLVGTLLGRAWLTGQGVTAPPGALVLAPFGARVDPEGVHVNRVALGAQADHVLMAAQGRAYLLPVREATVTPDGVPGSLAVSLRWPAGVPAALPGTAEGIAELAAAGQAALLAGAAQRVLAFTLAYAQERTQFGRDIGKFQAIQHQIAVMAEHVAMMRMAGEIACTAASDGVPTASAASAGMAVCAQRAGDVANIGHAVHGAIGVTAEHALQSVTRRLHQWSSDLGSAAYWAQRLGQAVLDDTGSALDHIRHAVHAEQPA